MRDGKKPLRVLLAEDIFQELSKLTLYPGSSKTQIVTDALRAYFTRHASNELDERFAIRLDKQTRAIETINNRLSYISEALGTFIQHQLTLAAHQPPFDQDTAKLGRLRYDRFIDLVGQRIAKSASKRRSADPIPAESEEKE